MKQQYYVHDRRADNNPPYIFTGTLAECQQYIKNNSSPFLSCRQITQSKDTVPEMEWDLYPGNEAGAFDHLEDEQYGEDMNEALLPDSRSKEESSVGFTGAKWYLIPTSFKPVGELRDVIIAEMDINVTKELLEENESLSAQNTILKETLEVFEKDREVLVSALKRIYNIENAAFSLKGFDVERMKAEINQALQQVTKP